MISNTLAKHSPGADEEALLGSYCCGLSDDDTSEGGASR